MNDWFNSDLDLTEFGFERVPFEWITLRVFNEFGHDPHRQKEPAVNSKQQKKPNRPLKTNQYQRLT